MKGRKPPNAGIGRQKGVPNKLTRTVKEAIEIAAEGLGGAARLTDWAKEDPQNERAFWATIYPKLLPLQVTGKDGGPLQIVANPSTIDDSTLAHIALSGGSGTSEASDGSA